MLKRIAIALIVSALLLPLQVLAQKAGRLSSYLSRSSSATQPHRTSKPRTTSRRSLEVVRPGIAVKSPVNPKRNTVASICWKVKPIIDSVEYD